MIHKVMASSFADPADVKAFNAAKRKGLSDKEAFAVGDNGIGCWGHVTAQDKTPMCALPPDDMGDRWRSVQKANGALVRVKANGRSVVCILADRMPWRRNIKNGAGIDLNPGAAKALGLNPPFMVEATWEWVEGEAAGTAGEECPC